MSPIALDQPVLSQYEEDYHPQKILSDPKFKVLPPDAPELNDANANLGCFYNEKHEINMTNKPIPKARKGECVVHVKASGICG